jgi:hypothetical protein
MLAQLCMIVDRISVLWNSGAWDFGYVDLLIRSFVTVFIISFSIDIDRSQLSAILPLCNYRRNATGATCMALWQIGFSTRGSRTAGCEPKGFPFLSSSGHVDFEIFCMNSDIWNCTNFDPFDTFKFVLWAPTRSGKLDGLRPGPASQFWCLDVEGFCMLRCSYCAVIGTRNLHYVMSHNL